MTSRVRQWAWRAGWLGIVGLWLVLPVDYGQPTPVSSLPSPYGADAGQQEAALWVQLVEMQAKGQSVQVWDEHDSVVFQGTPDSLLEWLETHPQLLGEPREEFLLPPQ